jgi:hypothetical protein
MGKGDRRLDSGAVESCGGGLVKPISLVCDKLLVVERRPKIYETKVEAKKAFSRHDHPHLGLSFQMLLLLEFGGGFAHHEHRDR